MTTNPDTLDVTVTESKIATGIEYDRKMEQVRQIMSHSRHYGMTWHTPNQDILDIDPNIRNQFTITGISSCQGMLRQPVDMPPN